MSRRKRTFILAHEQARRGACRFIMDEAKDGDAVTIGEPNRTLEQNAAQWPYLAGFSQQRKLCINGEMIEASEEDWKDILTGVFRGETQRCAMFDGKLFMLGQRTSKFGKEQFSEWLEFLISMAAMHGITPVYKNPARNGAHE